MADEVLSDTIAETELRGIPLDELLEAEPDRSTLSNVPPTPGATESATVRYSVTPIGEPQDRGTKFYVDNLDTGERVYVGQVAIYGNRRGLSRYSEDVKYERAHAEASIGAWAHFIWPSVMAESGGRHLVINAWDRAHFTWGFYQLAAHTAKDNLILLMRELLKLPTAARFFPDLLLDNGKLHRRTSNGTVTLEREVEVDVGSWTETQLPDFMAYLNTSSRRLDNQEVITSAKFLAWAREDPAMLDTTIRVSTEIMQRKIARLAQRLDLIGRRPELAIWISDMFHQGRGSFSQASAALSKPTLREQLAALSQIDVTGAHAPRRATVNRHVDILINEGRFANSAFGEGELALPVI